MVVAQHAASSKCVGVATQNKANNKSRCISNVYVEMQQQPVGILRNSRDAHGARSSRRSRNPGMAPGAMDPSKLSTVEGRLVYKVIVVGAPGVVGDTATPCPVSCLASICCFCTTRLISICTCVQLQGKSSIIKAYTRSNDRRSRRPSRSYRPTIGLESTLAKYGTWRDKQVSGRGYEGAGSLTLSCR